MRALPVLIAVLLLSPLSCSQDLEASDAFEIDAALLRECWSEAERAIEAALELEMPETKVRLAEPADIAKVLRPELERQLRAQGIEDPETQARLGAGALSMALLGKYAFDSQTILICATNFENLSKLMEKPELNSRQCLQAVLVHEAMHALDDQRHEFGKVLDTLSTAGRFQAYQAIIEGYAQHRARQVCEQQGWKEAFDQFTSAIGWVPEKGDEATKLLSRVAAASMSVAYYDGERFVATLLEGQGDAEQAELVGRLFREPPADLDVILHPEWYLDPSKRPELKHDFEGALTEFSKTFEGWNAQQAVAVKPQIAAALALLPKESVEQVVGSLLHNRLLVMAPAENPAQQVIVGLYEFKDAAGALGYVAAFEQLGKLKDEAMKTGSIRIVDPRYESIRRPGFQAVLAAKGLEGAGPDRIETLSLVGARGSIAVEMVFSNATLRDDELVKRAEELCRRAVGDAVDR